MLFNKVSGAAEKVTIDGQKVDKRLDLEKDFAIKYLPHSTNFDRITASVFHPKKNTYFIFQEANHPSKLKDKRYCRELLSQWESFSKPPENIIGAFIRNDEIILVGGYTNIYKLDDSSNTYTRIGGGGLSYLYGCWYIKEKDELYGSYINQFYKFDFIRNTWTKVNDNTVTFSSHASTVKENDIYWFGITVEGKNILKFDGKNFTEIKNVLPYKVGGYSLKVGVLNNKIHLLGSMYFNENKTNSNCHFVEGENIFDWIRYPDIPSTVLSKEGQNCESHDGAITLFGLSGIYNSGDCLEIVEVYKEREV